MKNEKPGQRYKREIEQISLLIVANRTKSFETAATFLIRRGHPCTLESNPQEAIKFIAQKRPQVVLLSWNLTNSNITKLYNFITNTLKCFVIVFAESTDTKTAAELLSSAFPEIMHAPVSGLGIYMRIQRVAETYEEVVASRQKSLGVNQSIPVRGAQIANNGEWVLKGADPTIGKNIWEFKTTYLQTYQGRSSLFFFKGENPPTKSKVGGGWETSEIDGSFDARILTEEEENELLEKEVRELVNKGLGEPTPSQEVQDLEAYIISGGQKTRTEEPILVNAKINTIDISRRLKTKGSERLAVMLINSTLVKGYLFAKTESPENMDEAELAELKIRAIHYLEESGEVLDKSDLFNLSVEQINFKAWNEKFAEMLALAPNFSERWGLAFFPFDGIQPNIEKKHEGMVAVDMEEVFPDMKLSFDLFVHFPMNNRYFLYCKTGQYISEEQKNRMSRLKTKHFFIKEAEIPQFKEFCAINRIQAKILNYAPAA